MTWWRYRMACLLTALAFAAARRALRLRAVLEPDREWPRADGNPATRGAWHVADLGAGTFVVWSRLRQRVVAIADLPENARAIASSSRHGRLRAVADVQVETVQPRNAAR